jgi:hypothetical protein
VTLVVSLQSRRSLWLVADRRLSYRGRPPKDDGMKVMELATSDGIGLLAYAGLGATIRGKEPSEWMSAALRGRGGLSFEQSLLTLSEVASRELPKHLAGLPVKAHFIVVPAFVRGVPRLYSIDNLLDRTGRHWYRCTRHVRTVDHPSSSVRLAMAGSGGIYLAQKGTAWQRELRRLAKAHDRGQVSDRLIADRLAELNYEAHRNVADGTVGPRCVVVWRRRPDPKRSLQQEHLYYTGLDRELSAPPIPASSHGMDSKAIANVLLAQFQRRIAGYDVHDPDAQLPPDDTAETNRLLAKLPEQPDERLR